MGPTQEQRGSTGPPERAGATWRRTLPLPPGSIKAQRRRACAEGGREEGGEGAREGGEGGAGPRWQAGRASCRPAMPLAVETRSSVESSAQQGSRLLARGPYDGSDELERGMVASAGRLQSVLGGSEGRIHSWLQERVSEGDKQHADVVTGLLHGILTDAQAGSKLMGYMTSITRDGYAACLATLQRLVMEKWGKLLEGSRAQIVWMVRQLVPLAVNELDQLCFCLLRQVAGGDLSPSNVWLASQLLDILCSNRTWVYSSSILLTTALYTFLRLLPDHASARAPGLAELRQNEAAFCCQVLKERFQDCLVIGRDLVRLLQDVAALPEFEAIWRDLLNNPAGFQAPFSDLAQLYVVRTPTRYLTSRVTPDMETQLRFMLTHVRMGNQRRYQAWFAQRFLATPESETLVCDLIRFICCTVHPPNQILQSDIVPRWAVVGWLLKCCKSSHVEANAKLALFYDWLFFMSKTDNIMNIEPAILLMVHSIPKYVDMTNSLLDFLFLLMENYDTQHKDLIQRGVASSVDILVGKGVVRSLEPLATSPLVAQVLRDKLHSYFPAHCKTSDISVPHPILHPSPDLARSGHVNNLISTGPPAIGDTGIGSQGSGPTAGGGRTVQGTETSVGASREGPQGSGQPGVGRGKPMQPSQPVLNVEKGLGGGTTPGKRKRGVSVEEASAELKASLDWFAEAVSTGVDTAVPALEQVLQLYTTTWDSLGDGSTEKRARGSSGGLLNGHLNHVLEASAFAPSSMAQQLAEIVGKAGYQLFAPLRKIPSNEPEANETGSLTSTILRLFVVTRHPQLRRILLHWQAQGRNVNPRLLCHVARLAEELEQEVPTSTTVDGLSSNAPAEHSADGIEGEGQENKGGLILESDNFIKTEGGKGLGGAELLESAKAESIAVHERGQSGASAGPSSEGGQEEEADGEAPLNKGFDRGSRLGILNMDLHTHGQAAVKKAFQAYEEFLRDVGNGPPLPHTSAAVGLRGSADGAATKVKGEEGEGGCEERAVLLLSALETCLLWNAYRLLRVLPSVFRYLPHMTSGREAVVRLLLGVADPQEIAAIEASLALGEYDVIGTRAGAAEQLVRASVKWDAQEQQWLWQLLTAEAQSWPFQILVALVNSVSSGANGAPWPEALSGLFSLLRSRRPTAELLTAVLSMPSPCGKTPAAILSAWSADHHSLMCSLIEQQGHGTSVKVEHEHQGGNHGGQSGPAQEASCSGSTAALSFLTFLKRRHGVLREELLDSGNVKKLVAVLTRYVRGQESAARRDCPQCRDAQDGAHVGKGKDKHLVRRNEGREGSSIGRPVGNSSNG